MTSRLRLAARPKDEDSRILPLINVVFLLLIFFMITGRLASADLFKVEPPTSERAGQSQQEAPLVLLGADGRLAVDGAEITLAALTQRLTDRDLQKVRLKADQSAEAVRVVEVMQALHAAGIARVRLLAVAGPS